MPKFGLVPCRRWVWRQKKLALASSFFSTITEHPAENENMGRPTLPGPPPIRVGLTESAGRGVFATRRIGAGDLIHTAKPIVSHPSLSTRQKVCYFCLRKLGITTSFQSEATSFCSEECKKQSKVYVIHSLFSVPLSE